MAEQPLLDDLKVDLTQSIGFELPWTAEDSAILRAFLVSQTGRRTVGQLLLKRPAMSERSDAFKRGIQSGIVEGYDDAIYRLGWLTDSSRSVKKATSPTK